MQQILQGKKIIKYFNKVTVANDHHNLFKQFIFIIAELKSTNNLFTANICSVPPNVWYLNQNFAVSEQFS